MLRDIFTNKWIIGCVFLLLGVIAFMVFMEIDTARHKRYLDQLHRDIQARARAASVQQSTQEVPSAKSETPTAEKRITVANEVKTVPHYPTEAKPTPEQAAAASAEPADAAEMPVSAFGFGAFPEVPEGLDFSPEWEDPGYPNYENSREQELISRVWIKAWKEGKRGIVGASIDHDSGKVYLNYPNTAYIWYEESEDEAYLRSGGTVTIRLKDFQSGNIPPGVTLIDGETAGIDPYEYLGLNR